MPCWLTVDYLAVDQQMDGSQSDGQSSVARAFAALKCGVPPEDGSSLDAPGALEDDRGSGHPVERFLVVRGSD